MATKHNVAKRGHMSQPAEGYYVDCTCGRTGGLQHTKEQASEDHRKHKAEAQAAEASEQ